MNFQSKCVVKHVIEKWLILIKIFQLDRPIISAMTNIDLDFDVDVDIDIDFDGSSAEGWSYTCRNADTYFQTPTHVTARRI